MKYSCWFVFTLTVEELTEEQGNRNQLQQQQQLNMSKSQQHDTGQSLLSTTSSINTSTTMSSISGGKTQLTKTSSSSEQDLVVNKINQSKIESSHVREQLRALAGKSTQIL